MLFFPNVGHSSWICLRPPNISLQIAFRCDEMYLSTLNARSSEGLLYFLWAVLSQDGMAVNGPHDASPTLTWTLLPQHTVAPAFLTPIFLVLFHFIPVPSAILGLPDGPSPFSCPCGLRGRCPNDSLLLVSLVVPWLRWLV